MLTEAYETSVHSREHVDSVLGSWDMGTFDSTMGSLMSMTLPEDRTELVLGSGCSSAEPPTPTPAPISGEPMLNKRRMSSFSNIFGFIEPPLLVLEAGSLGSALEPALGCREREMEVSEYSMKLIGKSAYMSREASAVYT